ncbi:MAG: Gfo/Idh/MocA family oxidoreductase [Planctomycetota bacterium]
MSNKIRFTRRKFLQATAATSAATMTIGTYGRVFGANERVNIAYVGTAGIAGGQHLGPFHGLGFGSPCYCDADAGRFGNAAKKYPDATGYTDYRKMYDKHMKEIDAVSIAAPDHHHYPATIIAMMEGKHAYTQKPLTHTMWEARQLKLATEKYKVATQMGNQMHANEGNRRIVEWIQSGKLGTIKEAHIWTNRPVWPQGNPRPKATNDKPEKLDWDAWLGPAAERPFSSEGGGRRGGPYHPFNWRGFQDFGTGALGDMGCHTTDGFYWGMDPGYPVAAELIEGDPVGGKDQYAKQAAVKFEFAAKGDRPAFNYFWYEGGMKPKKPEFIKDDAELPVSGGFIIGEKAAIQYMDDYGNKIKIHSYDGSEIEEPEKTLERSPGHHKEFLMACKGEKPYDYPKSGFLYAAMLTESVLLGTIAQKVGGRIEYDAENMKITNNAKADALITKEYRKGWEYKMG